MTRYLRVSLGNAMALAALIAALATTSPLQADELVYRMTRSVPPACAVPEAETNFLTVEKQAILWFSIPNLQAGSVVSSQYFSPGGTRYARAARAWNPAETDGTRCFDDTGAFLIAGETPASTPGAWTVTVKVDGTPLFTTTFTITEPVVEDFTLSAAQAEILSSASEGKVDLFAKSDTATWTAVSNAGWLSILDGASGTGNGTITYSAIANPDRSPRVGTLTIAGLTFTITQAASDLPDGTCVSGEVDYLTLPLITNNAHLVSEISIGGTILCPDCDLKPPVYGNFVVKLEEARLNGLRVDVCYDSFGTVNFLRMRK